jgi:hypothetical protein
MCTPEVILLLTEFVNELGKLAESGDSSVLTTLRRIQLEAETHITYEMDACLDSDPVLRKLSELFQLAIQAATLFSQTRSQTDLLDLASELLIIRNELHDSLEGATA